MKRFLAIIIAFFFMLSTFVPFAFADYSSSVCTLWDKMIMNFAKGSNAMDGVSLPIIGDSLGSLIPFLGSFQAHALDPGVICRYSDDSLHHADTVVPDSFDSDAHGNFVRCRCKYCGDTFKAYSDDAKQAYNDYLHSNNLDNGVAVTPEGGLIWYPTVSDLIDCFVYSGSEFITCPDFTTSFSYRSASYDYYCSNSSSLNFHFSNSSPGSGSDYFFGWRCSIRIPVSGSYTSQPFIVEHFRQPTSWDSRTYSFQSYSAGLYSFSGSALDSFSLFNYSTSWDCRRSYGDSLLHIPSFSVTPSSSVSTPSVPSTIDINNTTYNITDIDLENRIVHTTENYTIEYGDTEIKIYDGPTEIKVIQYVIENPSDPDPGPGGDTSDPDPGPGGDTSDPDPGPGGDGSGGAGCCEQCALLLRQANQYLLQIQTLVDQINDKLGDDGDNYTQGIYNLLIEIKSALENLPSEPHKDYEEKLNLIANQLANIWGDLETIKTSLSAVETNTAETNEKLDTVHSDLEAVLAELQTQRGILQQILDTLKKILGHVETIDGNVEELKDEESSNNFFNNFILKFHFLGDIFSIVRQLFADITNDAATVQLVDDGTLPIGDLSSQHFPIDGSPVAIGTAPEVLTRFPDDKYHGVDLSSYSALDLSWYARYKSRVDALLSGFLWIGYIWLLFKRAPGIVRGAAMVDETNIKIDDFRNGG